MDFLRAIHPGTYCKPARPLLPASAVTWLTPKFPHCAIQLFTLLPVAPFPGSSRRGLVPTSPLPTLQPSRGKTQSSLYETLRWSVRDLATPSGSPVLLLGSLAIPLPLQHVTMQGVPLASPFCSLAHRAVHLSPDHRTLPCSSCPSRPHRPLLFSL